MGDFIEIDYVENVRTRSEIENDDRVTDDTMTPNEYIRLLSWRARQLKTGMRPVIEWKERFDPVAISKEEINQRRVPLVIIRKIPDSRSETGFRDEIWEIKDLNIRDC